MRAETLCSALNRGILLTAGGEAAANGQGLLKALRGHLARKEFPIGRGQTLIQLWIDHADIPSREHLLVISLPNYSLESVMGFLHQASPLLRLCPLKACL